MIPTAIGQIAGDAFKLAEIVSPGARDFFLAAPELAWVATLCALMIAPIIVGRSPRITGGIALIGIAVIAWLTWKVGVEVAAGGLSAFGASAGTDGIFIADNLSIFFKMLLLVFLAGVIGLWWAGLSADEQDAPEFFVLLMGSALGMALMVSTQHVLMMVVAIEFASLPSYALVGSDKRNRLAAEASLKYVIFGSVCAAVMLYGASLLYGRFGSLNLADIAAGATGVLAGGSPADVLVVGMGLFCVFVGIAFKISAVPFHFWCPDAFQGARIEVTTWLSVASKAAGLLLLLRIVHLMAMHAGSDLLAGPAWVIAAVAALTCTVGNLAAYVQSSVKRMLAYSSIAHAGYMLMAAALFLDPAADASFPAIGSVLAYVVVYMFMNLGAFGVTAMVGWHNGGDDSIEAFSGLMRRSPALAIPMLFCLVSLVGLPPFAGFVAKYYLLSALGAGGAPIYWALIVVLAVNTLVSLWYYMRVVVEMMLRDNHADAFTPATGGVVLVNFCGFLLIFMLIFSQPLKTWTDRHARGLFVPDAANTAAVPVQEEHRL